MIDNGAEACFMRDKKGFLPAHVACSRHCSPEKLRMLLSVNPRALHDPTGDGHTLLSLATMTATKSHPNYALIDELNRLLTASATSPIPLDGEAARRRTVVTGTITSPILAHMTRRPMFNTPTASDASVSDASSFRTDPTESPTRPNRKRKTPVVPEDAAVNLLLHFSRHGSPRIETMGHTNFAEV